MNISLTKELERYVEEKVASGKYASASEVLRQGLRLMLEHDEREAARAKIRRKIEEGVAQLERGERIPLEDVLAGLRKKSAERRRR